MPPPTAEVARAFTADNKRNSLSRTTSTEARARRGIPGPAVRRNIHASVSPLTLFLFTCVKRAVPPAGIVAVVRRPRIFQRLQKFGRSDAAALCSQQRAGSDQQRCNFIRFAREIISKSPDRRSRRAYLDPCKCAADRDEPASDPEPPLSVHRHRARMFACFRLPFPA